MFVYSGVQLCRYVHVSVCLKVADALQAHLSFYPVVTCLFVYGNKHQ